MRESSIPSPLSILLKTRRLSAPTATAEAIGTVKSNFNLEVLMARVAVNECPKCHRKLGERHKAVVKSPGPKAIERWISDGVAKATDGCRVEPDGVCEHGHSSWLLVMGLI
jgi:hypothetical protein